MTHYTERNLTATCCYWAPTGQTDGFGTILFEDPVELDCRWEDVSLVDHLDREVQQQLRSEVFLKDDVQEQGMLLLGTLLDLDSDTFNDPIAAGAQVISRFDKLPTLRGDYFVRKAFVGRLWTGKT